MKSKLLLAFLLLPGLSYANDVSLDSLVSQQNNFCNQGQDGNLKGILSFLNLDSNSNLYFKGFKVTRIEIKTPKVKLQFSPDNLQQESKKYVSLNKPYPFKNVYSIDYLISFIVDASLDNLRPKIDNMNTAGVVYKKFGNYKPTILAQSKSMLEFENNVKTIQSSELNLAAMSNYETNMPRTSIIYQCKILSYSAEDINSMLTKASK